MIRMSLDKETVLSREVSPTLPRTVSLSEQLLLAKAHPFYPKNGLHPPGISQPPSTHTAAPIQKLTKRRYSMGVGLKGLTKRRRRVNSDSQSEPVLPSNFLLGGNIFDPLNLNSLLDEEVNKANNQETPKCSPLPSRGRDPVEILVPRDITDPLNLKGEGEDAKGERVLVSPLKSRRRHRNRHHGGGGERKVRPARLFPSTGGQTAITCRDDVATPPILSRRHTHPPAPGAQRIVRQRRRHNTTSVRVGDTITTAPPMKFQTPLVGGAKPEGCGEAQHASSQPPEKDKYRYQYGNHSCYYGYHCVYGDQGEGWVGVEEDPRLRLLEANWFKDKKVLDIGCGTGHMMIAIARRFDPAHILGVELDERLVHAAKQNVRHFLSHDHVVERRKRQGRGMTGWSSSSSPPRKWEGWGGLREEEEMEEKKKEVKMMESQPLLSFPLSFRVVRGPLVAPPLSLLPSSSSSRFPNNVTFIQGNYVSEHEPWPGQGQYDVILCLGLTKWVQLQSGDGGVVKLFIRAYQSLSPGGLFILEPQQWSSYSSSKRASKQTRRLYSTIRLRPELFTCYLMEGVGFSSYRLLRHTGSQRPIYLFHKGPAQRK